MAEKDKEWRSRGKLRIDRALDVSMGIHCVSRQTRYHGEPPVIQVLGQFGLFLDWLTPGDLCG